MFVVLMNMMISIHLVNTRANIKDAVDSDEVTNIEGSDESLPSIKTSDEDFFLRVVWLQARARICKNIWYMVVLPLSFSGVRIEHQQMDI